MTVPRLQPPLGKRAVEEYTMGLCYSLAARIAKLTGWPVHGVFGIHEHQRKTAQGLPAIPTHAFVETPEGYFLDAVGARTADEMLQAYDFWIPHVIAPVDASLLSQLDARRTQGVEAAVNQLLSGREITPSRLENDPRLLVDWFEGLRLPVLNLPLAA